MNPSSRQDHDLQPIEDQTQLTQYPSLRQEDARIPLCQLKSKLHKKSFIDDLTLLEKMCYKDAVSPFEPCPGGGPQGELLTGVLFILQGTKLEGPVHPPGSWKASYQPKALTFKMKIHLLGSSTLSLHLRTQTKNM